MPERVTNMRGIDTYVCDNCKAIAVKPSWIMNGNKCPECGCETFELRGKCYDRKIWIDGYVAQADGCIWADWAENGFLVGEPAPGLELKIQR